MKYLILILILISILLCLQISYSQHEESHQNKPFQRHKIGLFSGFTGIPSPAEENDQNGFIVVPTIGGVYEYWIKHKIGIGAISDIELATYVVEAPGREELKREFAWVSALVFIYEPIHWWAVYAGPGYEFEVHKSFAVLRVGTDFTKKFEEGWSVAAALVIDIKEVNSNFSLGITVGKMLGKKK
jgi:hypothetical protein